MAYVDFTETVAAAMPFAPAPAPSPARPKFSALEWSVVMLAARDKLSSLQTPGRVAVALGRLFGARSNPRLADPRLEALRRMAVLTWHHGYTVPGHAVRRFVTAGFSLEQYELLVDSIRAARIRNTREALA